MKCTEKEWRYLRSLHDKMLERFCKRILDDIKKETATGNTEKGAHKKYLDIYKIIHQYDKQIEYCFDDWRRSNITIKLINLINFKAITPEEISELSLETRNSLKSFFRVDKNENEDEV